MTGSIYLRIQCPQMMGWGEGAGMGWVGDSSVRLHSRVSGGGQCPARETGGKNNPGLPTLSALSQAGPWAWLQELFWCLGELFSLEGGPLSALPHPPFFPSPRPLATVGPCPAGRGRKGGPRLKEEGGGGVCAEPVL